MSVEELVSIKKSFAKTYSGRAHIQEVIPCNPASYQSASHLSSLHEFAGANPIYFNSYEQAIQGTRCTIYEGDINEYWLGSIKHGSSCQPFYPTWISSAYHMAQKASDLGFEELIDIGSGDGRIAYCAGLFGLEAHSIEIDGQLVELQETIAAKTRQDFNPVCCDALEFDYTQLNLKNPVFFIGGLPQMGGDMLAEGMIKKLDSAGMVLAGTLAKKELSSGTGWDPLISKYHLDVLDTITLPSVWTFDQETDTPYIYARFSRPQRNTPP